MNSFPKILNDNQHESSIEEANKSRLISSPFSRDKVASDKNEINECQPFMDEQIIEEIDSNFFGKFELMLSEMRSSALALVANQPTMLSRFETLDVTTIYNQQKRDGDGPFELSKFSILKYKPKDSDIEYNITHDIDKKIMKFNINSLFSATTEGIELCRHLSPYIENREKKIDIINDLKYFISFIKADKNSLLKSFLFVNKLFEEESQKILNEYICQNAFTIKGVFKEAKTPKGNFDELPNEILGHISSYTNIMEDFFPNAEVLDDIHSNVYFYEFMCSSNTGPAHHHCSGISA
jgi:hypothetical protein